MRLLTTFIRRYPSHSAFMVFALLVSGVLEGIGFSMLLPILSIAAGKQFGGDNDAALARLVADGFAAIGVAPTVGSLLLVLIIAVTLKSILVLLAKKQVGYTAARVATDLRLEMLQALRNSRWQYFLKQPIGQLANSMATEAARASSSYMHGVIMIADFIQFCVYGVIAFLISWQVTLIAITAGLVIVCGLKYFVRKARRAGMRQTELLKSLLVLLTDTLQSIKPLKAMGRENVSDFLLKKMTNRLNRALQKQVLNKEILKTFQEQMETIVLAAGLYIMLIYWKMPLPSIIVLILLVSKLLKQLNKVQTRYQEMAILESAYWSLKDSIEVMQQERETLAGNRTPELRKSIRLDRVSFAYDNNYVLQEVSLVFPVGRITAILGPSGSGKTTIVDLVTGLLRPQKGKVWIDEVPLVELDLKFWRRQIGYVVQEPILLHDTVLNNITLGDPELSENDAVDALRAAGAWQFVASLPHGIKSIVGERGGKLSGGQRQRIAIARAIVHRPKLLILDEATSALDPQSEAAVCETLQNLSGKLTILAISHQAALVKIADITYHIENGIIVSTEKDAADQPGEVGIKANSVRKQQRI
ncbi:MAG: ABC transporter ATP-binding protein [Desulfobacterales bacterium]|nr:MAG: ABC transporter ATP-binding protein [Desulfobacterales bacterium]